MNIRSFSNNHSGLCVGILVAVASACQMGKTLSDCVDMIMIGVHEISRMPDNAKSDVMATLFRIEFVCISACNVQGRVTVR
ncbi:hypothetical protein BDR04DRAFT_467712 [Suillus decipiens]|nr:hypothetical protein BDR04DRAFT_467712 [Suillus decipiens]